MAKEISKAEAILTLLREDRSGRRSKTALHRIRKACQSLGLTEEETAEIERSLDYRGYDDKVYAAFL